MTEYLIQILIYTGATAAMVPLFNRLGFGSVLGYLAAGLILGPSGLALVSDPELILHVAEFGVVLMLFLIGLELKPSRLWSLRRLVIGLGGLQVLGCTLAFAGSAYLLGLNLAQATGVGMALAVSSTALVLQMMDESKLRRTSCGQSVFSVLLFQDIVVLPMLALIPFLAGSGGDAAHGPQGLSGALIILLSVGAMIFLGRVVIRPVFQVLAHHGGREVFTAGAIFLVVAASLWMHQIGVSMALGTFLVGVLLADSQFRHELEISIQPFKGLLLGLFFISVGMSMDLGLIVKWPWQIPLGVLLAVGLKLGYQIWLGYRFGMMKGDALLFGLMLSQGGEFAFVLLGLAKTTGLLDSGFVQVLNFGIALSMISTPLLFRLRQNLMTRYPGGALLRTETDEAVPHGHSVILCGFGRFGQVIGRLLHGCGTDPVVLDNDANQVETLRRAGFPVYLGDPVRTDVLHAAGAAEARLLIVTMDSEEDINAIIHQAQKYWPHLKILARAKSRQHAMDLAQIGVGAIRETFESSLALGEMALRELGYGAYRAHRIAGIFRRDDLKFLKQQMERSQADGRPARLAAEERRMLAELLKEDALLHAVIEDDVDAE